MAEQGQRFNVKTQDVVNGTEDLVMALPFQFFHHVVVVINHIGIVTHAPGHAVCVAAAIQIVLTQAAAQGIATSAAIQKVEIEHGEVVRRAGTGFHPPQQRVIPIATIQGVVASAAHQVVIPFFAIQRIMATVAGHRVIARATPQPVAARTAAHLVVTAATVKILQQAQIEKATVVDPVILGIKDIGRIGAQQAAPVIGDPDTCGAPMYPGIFPFLNGDK